ncbi:hypothetical protein Tsubulata_025972, partial [Turnera subulata]
INRLNNHKNIKGKLCVIDKKNIFLIGFGFEEDHWCFQEGMPWVAANQHTTLKRWIPDTPLNQEKPKKPSVAYLRRGVASTRNMVRKARRKLNPLKTMDEQQQLAASQDATKMGK